MKKKHILFFKFLNFQISKDEKKREENKKVSCTCIMIEFESAHKYTSIYKPY